MNWDITPGWVIFIMCSVGGLIMIAGSLILLGKRIIVLDSEGRQSTSVELPFGVRLNTHFPVLVMLLLGVFLFALPIYKNPDLCTNVELHKKKLPEMVTLKGSSGSPMKMQARAVVAVETVRPQENISMKVPLNTEQNYFVLYTDLNDNRVYDVEKLDWDLLDKKELTYTLKGVRVQADAEEKAAPAAPAVKKELLNADEVGEFKEQDGKL